MDLKKGDRVTVSDEYKRKLWGGRLNERIANRKRGTILWVSRDQCVTIKWDALATAELLHQDFVRKCKPKEDLATALEALLGPLE